MEIGNMLEDSIGYAKEAVWEKWGRWILLILCSIIFPLMIGYTMEVYRGKKPAPELEHWGKLFFDGLKLLIAAIIYAIPVALVIVIFGGYALISAILSAPTPDYYSMNPELLLPLLGVFFVGLFIALILAIIIALIATIGFVRLARTDSITETFNFGAIFSQIGKIGWINYIIALIVLIVVEIIFGVLVSLLQAIPVLGWLIWLALQPPLAIFSARYITRIYDSAG
jgi:hypothetical protein